MSSWRVHMSGSFWWCTCCTSELLHTSKNCGVQPCSRLSPPEAGAATTAILRRALGEGRMGDSKSVPSAQAGHYILCTGGRIKAKERATGCGAIILKTDGHGKNPTPIWVGHMSYAGTLMTVHTADYVGLLTGLRECARKRYEPLHIIGDNANIGTQLRRSNRITP
ncbi:hypothetical protein PR003_g11466 [Phytophthora rubi]|uniref:RNase H type-1 domain-containing protein n=1 Tax=Phytophthora rubi TaxID=129364 RepID=A0A6A4FBM1_9STRA|nr:hypothetical protein PR002_g11017 [Phytophthora rubi]KAE9032312.1 hypothetical protein PR001_g10674 [Phytophthora rubi]KAE9338515.1 hypothetical protein PR003_g11466 [Phytophthora rubi]